MERTDAMPHSPSRQHAPCSRARAAQYRPGKRAQDGKELSIAREQKRRVASAGYSLIGKRELTDARGMQEHLGKIIDE